MLAITTPWSLDTLIWLVIGAFPAYGIYRGWRNRPTRVQSWREWATLASLVVVTVSFVLFVTFWVWPDFGAKAGSGSARFRHTALFFSLLAWLSVAGLVPALLGTAKAVKRIVVPLLILAALFWWAAMAGQRGGFINEEARERGLPDFPERQFDGMWSMNAATLQGFSRNANSIALGDDMRKVVAALGRPDRDGHVHKNDYIRIFTYYVSRHGREPFSSDSSVDIVFNSKAKVMRVCSDERSIERKNCQF